VTSISLTAGDWDVFGNITVSGSGAGNVQAVVGWVSLTSATIPDFSLTSVVYQPTAVAEDVVGLSTPYFKASLSSTTTVYLSARSTFPAGTANACGGIYAIRRR
jgi:hypothetical protein